MLAHGCLGVSEAGAAAVRAEGGAALLSQISNGDRWNLWCGLRGTLHMGEVVVGSSADVCHGGRRLLALYHTIRGVSLFWGVRWHVFLYTTRRCTTVS